MTVSAFNPLHEVQALHGCHSDVSSARMGLCNLCGLLQHQPLVSEALAGYLTGKMHAQPASSREAAPDVACSGWTILILCSLQSWPLVGRADGGPQLLCVSAQ